MRARVIFLALLCLSVAVAFAQTAPPGGPPAAGPDSAAEAPGRATGPAALPATAPADPAAAAGKVVAVTVYQGTALVTREVDVPAKKGLVEITAGTLPPQTVDSSLYTEGTDGIRVLSTRYRTRAVKEDTREEVRALMNRVGELQAQARDVQKQIDVITQNLQLLGKLENFTSATMQQMTDKGMFNADGTVKVATYVMDSRAQQSAAAVALQEKLQQNAEAQAFAQRQLAELTAGASRTERDAVIVVDKADGQPGKVRLNYLVGAATWRPQYKLRAGASGREKDPVAVEYLAEVIQQSGEDWSDVGVVLSTAEPMLNAAPPELLALDIAVSSPRAAAPTTRPMLGDENRTYTQNLRRRAQVELNANNGTTGWRYNNDAAALEQTAELLTREDDRAALEAQAPREGPSVTYHVKPRLTVPSRNDPQLIEVARIDLGPEWFYKAVPVLTPHVYRLAVLTNKSDLVLLPGEATMYLGTDFVGRMNVPLVAIGEQLTVGFGVDPQVQVARDLLNKTRSIQGGNQVHTYDYRIRVSSFKPADVTIQVWDRLPKGETESVAVQMVKAAPDQSADATFRRADQPKNLLRWDLTVKPGSNGERAATVEYTFKLEYARDVALGNFRAVQ